MINTQKKRFYYLFMLLATLCTTKVSADDSTVEKKIKPKVPVVINSKVKGSQQQPKVLYIMPWQGINTPIKVNGKVMEITLPQYAPINPSEFKQQVSDFNKQQKINHKGK